MFSFCPVTLHIIVLPWNKNKLHILRWCAVNPPLLLSRCAGHIVQRTFYNASKFVTNDRSPKCLCKCGYHVYQCLTMLILFQHVQYQVIEIRPLPILFSWKAAVTEICVVLLGIVINNCDWACKNRACGHMIFDYFFTLSSVITFCIIMLWQCNF